MRDITALLELAHAPVAIGFLNDAPTDLPRWSGGPVPAGCTFWRAAWEGQAFYTTPDDHYNCAVGAYTHRIALPMARESELASTIGLMVENDYLSLDEVPGIPVLDQTPGAVAYAPLSQATFSPSVVLIAASAAQAMLLYEAATRAGASPAVMSSLGRPACAALPLSLQTGAAALSLGCKGNRTFTELADGELYVSIPGALWPQVAEQLAAVVDANSAMASHYQTKKEAF